MFHLHFYLFHKSTQSGGFSLVESQENKSVKSFYNRSAQNDLGWVS